jgi:hypothetical protein
MSCSLPHLSMSRKSIFLTLALLAVAACAYAQGAGSATITGSITDPSGSIVPGTSVVIRNTDTGIERKTETGDAGIFEAPFLQPGRYEVQASKTGFADVLRKELVLQVGGEIYYVYASNERLFARPA